MTQNNLRKQPIPSKYVLFFNMIFNAPKCLCYLLNNIPKKYINVKFVSVEMNMNIFKKVVIVAAIIHLKIKNIKDQIKTTKI